ncbi:MAG: PD-(D/E)XK nuclease family protein, partial [Pseudomonadota bacterium]
QKVAEAMEKLATKPEPTPFGPGSRYEIGEWQPPMVAESSTTPGSGVALVDLATVQNPAANVLRTPSELGGDKIIDREGDGSDGGRLRGRRIHSLLEHLPGVADPTRVAISVLMSGADASTEDEALELLREAQEIISQHSEVFESGSLAEVDVAGYSPTLKQQIAGTIDRLIVNDDLVRIVDFKTNVAVPSDAEETPEAILRQMGAYLEIMEGIYPGREIEVAVLWTTTGQLMTLGHGIVRAALARATTS